MFHSATTFRYNLSITVLRVITIIDISCLWFILFRLDTIFSDPIYGQTKDQQDDFNPRAGENVQKESTNDTKREGGGAPWSQAEQSYNAYAQSRRDHGGADKQRPTAYDDPNQYGSNKGQGQGQGQQEQQYGDGPDGYNRLDEQHDVYASPSKRSTSDAGRRHSLGHEERKERKERRRRQSGDIEGMREREDYMGSQREQRDSRRYGDESRGESRRHGERDRDESRGHRRHSKNRRSTDGGQFQDVRQLFKMLIY